MNENIIRSYYQATLNIPDQPYRKEMTNNWRRIYPESKLTEQRICDQRRTILSKVETNENTHGNWLSALEIEQIREEVQAEINTRNIEQE